MRNVCTDKIYILKGIDFAIEIFFPGLIVWILGPISKILERICFHPFVVNHSRSDKNTGNIFRCFPDLPNFVKIGDGRFGMVAYKSMRRANKEVRV